MESPCNDKIEVISSDLLELLKINNERRMVQQASGQVRSLIGTVNPSSIYRTEQMDLLMNKNILGLDELNVMPRYTFGNY